MRCGVRGAYTFKELSNQMTNPNQYANCSTRSIGPLIPTECSEPTIWHAEGLGGRYLLQYPFGVVCVSEGTGAPAGPMRGESIFGTLNAACSALNVTPARLIKVSGGPMRRYRILAARNCLLIASSVWIHSYVAAAMFIERLETGYRFAHRLELELEFLIEDDVVGTASASEAISELGPTKDVIYAAPKVHGGPDWLLRLPGGCAALWTGGNTKEELWKNEQLMLLYYGLGGWPSKGADPAPPLPEYSIVRVDGGQFRTITTGYHSLLHAGRVAAYLMLETNVLCTVLEGTDPHYFDEAVLYGDVVRFSSDAIQQFHAAMSWNQVTLTEAAASCQPRRFGTR